MSQGPSGELVGRCPTMPTDLEANVGDHVDTTNPSQTEEVFGSVHRTTTDLNRELGLALPVGHATDPANTNEGAECIPHRTKLAVPVAPGQGHLGDAADDVPANSQWLHEQGAIAIVGSNPRNEHRDAPSLLQRGSDQHGTPSAPCGRVCRSHGSDSQAQSRHDVCGVPCPPEEPQHGPYRYGVRGSCHRMTCKDHPRLIGPMPRGTSAWQRLSGARSASERTNSSDQDVIAKAHPLRMRGLKAFRFAGAMRTLAQLLLRALHFGLDVTSTRGKTPWSRT